MNLSGNNTLNIRLVNTSSATAPTGAGGLLTGLAFDLPHGVDVLGGSVSLYNGSVFVNSSTINPSTVWGFQNASAPGHFNGLAVDTVIACMSADTTQPFLGSSVLAGPNYGLLSNNGSAGGLPGIQNGIVISLNLSGSVSLTDINNGLVAIEFGSPTGGSVPDGGSTLALLGLTLFGAGVLRRHLVKA